MSPLSRVGFQLHKTVFVLASSKRVFFIFTTDERLCYRGASEMARKSHSLSLRELIWIDLNVFVSLLQMSIEVRSSCNSICDFATACLAYCFSCLVVFHLVLFKPKSCNLLESTSGVKPGVCLFTCIQHVEHRRYYNITFIVTRPVFRN